MYVVQNHFTSKKERMPVLSLKPVFVHLFLKFALMGFNLLPLGWTDVVGMLKDNKGCKACGS